MTYVIGALVVVSLVEAWLLGRIVRRVGAIGRLEDRVSSLTHTIALLTDTTEACFNVVAGQLEPAARSKKARTARQRRVVGAASKGRSIAEIAADEEMAESEVGLRIALDRRKGAWDGMEHGDLRS
jgi:DNA-binding NarL/FixJ family response regulator